MIYRILFFILHTRKKTSLTIKVYTSNVIYIFASVVQNRNKLLFLHCTILYDHQKPCVCVTNTNDTHTLLYDIQHIIYIY